MVSPTPEQPASISQDSALALPAISRSVVYAGSFDPFTLGHRDIAMQAARLFDRVIVAIGVNPSKTSMFTEEERCLLIKAELAGIEGNFEVESFRGLVAHYADQKNALGLVRGVRNITDFAQEIQLATTNREQSRGDALATTLLPPRSRYEFVSSSAAKQLLTLEGDLNNYVSPLVETAMRLKTRGEDVVAYLKADGDTPLPTSVATDIVFARWMKVARELDIPHTVARPLGEDIVAKYSQPGRHYHNIEHIAEGLLNIDTFQHKLTGPTVFTLAWLFHDYEYNPQALHGDNERASAQALHSALAGTSVSEGVVAEAARLIALTIDHNSTDGADTADAYFIDTDLAILGSSTARYQRYTRDVRQEYEHYEDCIYYVGRSGFLQRMLSPKPFTDDAPKVFNTALFEKLYGERAKANLYSELQRVTLLQASLE